MNDTLRLLRVFLASPGDLQDERRLANDAVEELNKQIAPFFGYRVELVGWEDTLPKIGRPQEIINQDLDRCELFIGIMWKRWGTPPANSGPYTSGFEEEFKRSISRFKETGKPDMAMYFKDLDSDDLSDPGPNLKKVIEFKNDLISEKYIFFSRFSTSDEFQRSVRDKITEYLINLNNSEKEKNEELQSKTKSSELVNENVKEEFANSPLSIEGHNFLKGFLDTIKNSNDEVTPLNVARFRLLSSAITQTENDKFYLGVHDANIIFANSLGEYGRKERSMLISSGLNSFTHENVPLWYWYENFTSIDNVDVLAFKSLNINSEKISVGALEAMKLAAVSLDFEDDFFKRKVFIQSWFSKKSSDEIRLAALRYLKIYGKHVDIELIEPELNKTNSNIAKLSLEAILSIQLRYKKSDAINTVFTKSFDSIDQVLLKEVLSTPAGIDKELLELGIKHRNEKVRFESFKRIIEIREITEEELNELKNDPYEKVRLEVVTYLKKNNHLMNDYDVKSILVKPQEMNLFGSNKNGEVIYEEYLLSSYTKKSEKQLIDLVNQATVFDSLPYIALCTHFFNKYSTELRKAIDNQFQEWIEEYIEGLQNRGIPDDTVSGIIKLKATLTKERTRKGLDILCRKKDVSDLTRIRKNMATKFVGSSTDEIVYMQTFGDWEDIPLIVEAKKEYTTGVSILSYDHSWDHMKAKAMYNIGKERLSELFQQEMPASLLVELIKVCSISKFNEIPDGLILKFLNNDIDNVRKFASLKIIQSFNKTRMKALLQDYIQKEENRYYNVIHWLDFGVSMPKTITRKAVRRILKES